MGYIFALLRETKMNELFWIIFLKFLSFVVIIEILKNQKTYTVFTLVSTHALDIFQFLDKRLETDTYLRWILFSKLHFYSPRKYFSNVLKLLSKIGGENISPKGLSLPIY